MKDSSWFASKQFEQEYHYDKTLGAFCGPEGSWIRLWALTAEVVFLHFYPTGKGSKAQETVPMEKGEKGVWFYRTVRNLDGVYYDFDVTVESKT